MEAKFNIRNPGVKRILQEMKEMQSDTSCDFIAEALEGDIFEWHFVIRGPPDTEFEGGVYHGRILLPSEYPFKPPSFMMLTPSGRFETSVKICLSISSHHPEHWQPSWSVRTALTALIAFMPSPGAGALGSLDFTKEERRKMALRARNEVPVFGSAERQRLNQDMHQRMLQRMASGSATTSGSAKPVPGAEQQEQAAAPATQLGEEPSACAVTPETPAAAAVPEATAANAQASTTSPAPTVHASAAAPGSASPAVRPQGQAQVQAQVRQGHSADHGLTLLAIALSVCIAAILLRKVLAAFRAADAYSMF